MFKALILTEKLIKHPHSTLNRQIISQTNPLKSPNKLQQSPSSSLQKQHQSIHKAHHQKYPFKITQIQGALKLFHQYQLQRIQDNFNQLIIDRKRQQITTLAHLKTNILAIVNVFTLQEKQKILQRLSQVKQQIETVDIFAQNMKNAQHNSKPIISYSIVIYFHNSLMSQQFYNLSYKQFLYLPVYLKQVIILQRQSSQQISYKDVLSSFRYIEPHPEQQHKLSLTQKDIQWFREQQRQWIQLPKCVNCLLKLEFQVSGIDQKLLYFIVQSRNQHQLEEKQKQNTKNKQNTSSIAEFCSTCRILAQHRKQSDIQRKLSFQADYKDHHKSQKHAHCDDCKQNSDIWICMVCGRVGCGRYKNADAQKHFVKSGHIITIDLETQRVWNYLSDCFSHKLLKNINQSPSSVRFPQISTDQSEKIEQSKLQAAFWQYCSVFSQEMERQRIFYQNIKMSEEQKFQQQNCKLESITKQLQKETQQKSLQLKRTLKKKAKSLKKQKQLQQKVNEEREILKQHEQCLSADWMKDYLQKDEDIMKKKSQLQQLEVQLSEVLVQLSSN